MAEPTAPTMAHDASVLAGIEKYRQDAEAMLARVEAKTAALASAALARRELGALVHDRDESDRPVFDNETFAKFLHITEKLAEEALRREMAAFFGLPQALARDILKEQGGYAPHNKGHFVVKRGRPPSSPQEELAHEKGNFRPSHTRK